MEIDSKTPAISASRIGVDKHQIATRLKPPLGRPTWQQTHRIGLSLWDSRKPCEISRNARVKRSHWQPGCPPNRLARHGGKRTRHLQRRIPVDTNPAESMLHEGHKDLHQPQCRPVFKQSAVRNVDTVMVHIDAFVAPWHFSTRRGRGSGEVQTECDCDPDGRSRDS